MEGGGFQDMDTGEVQDLTDTILEALTEDNSKETSVSKAVAGDEEEDMEAAEPETDWLRDLAPWFQSLSTALMVLLHGPFYGTGTETKANGGRIGTI